LIVVDSDVISELTRQTPAPEMISWLDSLAADEVVTTAITAAELLYGVARLPDGRRKTELTTSVRGLLSEDFHGRILCFDEPSASRYADRCPRDPQHQRLRGNWCRADQPVEGAWPVTDENSAMPAAFTYPSADGTLITAYRWEPAASPRAIVQLTHGMGEHARRYDHVARTLTDAGYVVYAQDHRGHGQSVLGEPGDLGDDGWTALVADIGGLSAVARAEHPGLPLILLAHSMGSFAAQQYLLDHGRDLDGVILTGTAVLDLLEPALDLDQPLDLAMFNAPFAPARTDYDWLSRDEAIVDAYVADPLCGFGIDTASAKAMFAGARRLADADAVAAIPGNLPVYIAAGEMDPVNAGLALLTPLAERLRDAGLTDVTVVTYSGARHEILNETNRDEVLGSIVDWIGPIAG